MSQPAPAEDGAITFDEFCRRIPDGQKADLLDGVIYVASPDTFDANRLNSFLCGLLESYVGARKLRGLVTVNRFAYRIDEHYAPEPDVAYIAPERIHLVKKVAMEGGPDLAIEIVSRDSRKRDYGEKRELYERAGVREYWIIDRQRSRADFLRLIDGQYQQAPLVANRFFVSDVIAGFWLNVDWLFAAELPNVFDCLQEVLAGSPEI